MSFVADLFNYRRRVSSEVSVGAVPLGGTHPIRIQSMTNTSTMDTDGSVEQCIRIIDAGADYVRLTAQGEREATNLAEIRKQLTARGYNQPLVADIHFNPKAAEVAAAVVEKVRINPGNFVDPARVFSELTYTDEEYAAELTRLKARFLPLLDICKKHHTALRIGINHGSLSDRIMSRYGDTPGGMVESCMEFLRICKEVNFSDVAISIKASNTVIMVTTVRMLVETMRMEGMCYPLHLGVTEAGDGEDGRVKSAVGIGALLADGIGDTIRVSLSEEPEVEVPVARKLVTYFSERVGHDYISGYCPVFSTLTDGPLFRREVRTIPGCNLTFPLVVSRDPQHVSDLLKADVVLPNQVSTSVIDAGGLHFYRSDYTALTYELIATMQKDERAVLLLETTHRNGVGEQRAAIFQLMKADCTVPVVLSRTYQEDCQEDLQLKAAADLGLFFMDGLADGICLHNEGTIPAEALVSLSFGILQAARKRVTKTEYISCPGCGRTLFDLQQTIARVKAATSHLTGLKIGIMGCIVNGPGEMADADYGYVGAARGKISLYKGKVCIEKNIPEEEAVDKLIALIKANGEWKERP